jgi:hypothetical protein
MSAGDLADWRTNYGTGGLVASFVSDLGDSPEVPAALVSDQPAAASAATTENQVLMLGWILPLSSTTATVIELESPELDFAYYSADEYEAADFSLAESDVDFGNIATNRTVDDEDSDDLSAEDAVFELIGAGAI